MKGRQLILFIVLISLFFFFPVEIFAQGPFQKYQKGQNVVVKKGEVINQDFFAGGQTVTISGVVNGDVYIAGGNVTVDGRINGDLLAAGGTINLLGEVSDDVRVVGGNITVNGTVGKNLTVVGGNVIISNQARISGSLLAFSGNLDLRAPLGRGANVYAGNALIGSSINGDLRGSIEELALISGARISGNLDYESPKEAGIAEEVFIGGETIHRLPKEREIIQKRPLKIAMIANVSLKTFSFVVALIFGLLFVFLFPNRAQGVTKVLETRYWRSLGVGILAIILFIPALILLTISIIGIPLIFLFAPLFAFLVYFSKIFASLCLGGRILQRTSLKKSQAWALVLGLVIYYLLRLIPIVSPLVAFVFAVFGLGAFLLYLNSLRLAPRAKGVSKKG